MSGEPQLLKLASKDRGFGDVVDESIDLLAAMLRSQIGEPEGCRARKDASLIATGSGSGSITGPSQQV